MVVHQDAFVYEFWQFLNRRPQRYFGIVRGQNDYDFFTVDHACRRLVEV